MKLWQTQHFYYLMNLKENLKTFSNIYAFILQPFNYVLLYII